MTTTPEARPGTGPGGTTAALIAGLAIAMSAAAPAHAAGTVALMADLTGAQVVGRAADSDGSGRFIASLDTRSRQLCYEIELRLVGQITAAAIYAGRAGRAPAAGLVTLALPDARGRGKACQSVTAKAAKALAGDPSSLHISVHNPLYPGGALRGQLAAGGPGLAADEGEAEPQRVPLNLPPPPPRPPREGGYTGPTFTGS